MSEELDQLIVNGKKMDRKLVAEILLPYLRLDKDTCSIRPLKAWTALSAPLKIVLYLLARKAMVALGFNLPAEGAKAGEVISSTGLKKGTALPTLRKLLADRLVDQSEDGKYLVPNYAIEYIRELVNRSKGGQSEQGGNTKENRRGQRNRRR